MPPDAALDGSIRIVVTRDERADGPLCTALRSRGFDPHPLPVSIEVALDDAAALCEAAAHLERYAWVVCASVRAVTALADARRGRGWPAGLRSAAVGRATAHALVAIGADPPPVVAPAPGADALLAHLTSPDHGRQATAMIGSHHDALRVLALTVDGGRRTIIDGLRAAGAVVDDVVAYRMAERPPADVAAAWRDVDPVGVVVTSPSAARGLVRAVGVAPLRALRVVVAIGSSTGDALSLLGIDASVAPRPEFGAVAAHAAAALSAT